MSLNETLKEIGKCKNTESYHNYIPGNYNNSSSFSPFMMHDKINKGMIHNNEIYGKYIELINNALRVTGSEVSVELATGSYGLLRIVNGSGKLYIKDTPADVVVKYNSKSDCTLFSIIFIDESNNVWLITAKNEKQRFVVDSQTVFDNSEFTSTQTPNIEGGKTLTKVPRSNRVSA